MRSALTKVDGVISAEVSLPDKAVIKLEPGKTNVKALIKAVEDAGYGATEKK